jgi:GcrA cell cycle regulator
MNETRWTMERIALLKNRIRAGFSCGQIARELGVSRNAVIGKTNRLGLSRFKNTTSGTRQNARPRTVTRQINLRALGAKPQLAFPELGRKSAKACCLLDLQCWHCRWPMGDPTSQDFRFCGSRPMAGLPYCPAHAQMAYRPRSRDAVRVSRAASRDNPTRTIQKLPT